MCPRKTYLGAQHREEKMIYAIVIFTFFTARAVGDKRYSPATQPDSLRGSIPRTRHCQNSGYFKKTLCWLHLAMFAFVARSVACKILSFPSPYTYFITGKTCLLFPYLPTLRAFPLCCPQAQRRGHGVLYHVAFFVR